MQWTDRIRQVKIILVLAAIVIAVTSLLISHYLAKDLSKEEHKKMEVWAQALHMLNHADETTDLTLVLDVIQGNTTIPIIVLNSEGGIDDFRNIEDTTRLERYAQEMLQSGDTIHVGDQSLPIPILAVGYCHGFCRGGHLCSLIIEESRTE